jgi:hypothetical protein
MILEVVRADIARQPHLDTVVNSANANLVEYHTSWVELTYIISHDGFGWGVYVPVDHPFIETLPPQN